MQPFENVKSQDPVVGKPYSYGRTKDAKGKFTGSILNMHEGVSCEDVEADEKVDILEGFEVSKQQMYLRSRPTTKKQQRNERLSNIASGATTAGVLSGGLTAALNPKGGRLKPGLQMLGIGGAIGGALGASQKPRKRQYYVSKAMPKAPGPKIGLPQKNLLPKLKQPMKPVLPQMPKAATVPGTKTMSPMRPRVRQTGVSKAFEESAAALGGGGLAYGGYMGAGHGATRIANKKSRGMSRSESRRFQKYRSKMGMPYDKKAFADAPKADKNRFFANYPEDLPGGKLRRNLQRTHGAGKYGKGKVAVPLTLTGAAAAAGGAHASERKKNRVR